MSSYTWSKAIDNVSELFNYGNTATLALWAVPGYFGGGRIDRAVSPSTGRIAVSFPMSTNCPG